MKRRAKSAAVLAAAVLALAAAACGSSSSGTTGNGSATQAAAPTSAPPNKGTIVVGTICSCSGVDASTMGPNALATYQAWESWTNTHGGINGYTVKLIVQDDGLNPTTSLAEVKTLVQQDHVAAIIGENSLVDATWAPYVQQQGVPVIGGIPVNPTMNANPDFFPTGTGQANQIAAQYVFMKQHSLKHFGVMVCTEAQVCASLPSLSKTEASIIDPSITIASTSISNSQPNFDAACLSMKDQGVDGLEVAESSTTVPHVIAQCAQLGYKPTVIGNMGIFNQSLLQDSNFSGSWWVAEDANFLDPSVPGVMTYHQALQQYAPQVLSSPLADANDEWEWSGLQMFIKAAELAHLTPSSTPADLKAGLYKIKDETLNGLTPPITYIKGQPTNPPGFFLTQIQNGKLVGNALVSFTPAQQQMLDKLAASF